MAMYLGAPLRKNHAENFSQLPAGIEYLPAELSVSSGISPDSTFISLFMSAAGSSRGRADCSWGDGPDTAYVPSSDAEESDSSAFETPIPQVRPRRRKSRIRKKPDWYVPPVPVRWRRAKRSKVELSDRKDVIDLTQDDTDSGTPPLGKKEASPDIVIMGDSEASVSELCCGICADVKPVENFVTCDSKTPHMMCRECLRSYWMESILGSSSRGSTSGKSMNKCPYGDCCIDMNTLESIIGEKNVRLYNRKALSNTKGFFDCPNTSCDGWGFRPSNVGIVHCNKCFEPFCSSCLHFQGHPGLTCEENKDRITPIDKKSEEAISKMAVRCPSCNMAVSRTEGCNKMTCSCGQYFCYQCGDPVPHINPYSHFCSGPETCSKENCKHCRMFN